MEYPPLIHYKTVDEYRNHFLSIYCNGTILTFDNIEVRFKKFDFEHCFFESSNRDKIKDIFSKKRAERIDWIKATLQDNTAILKLGWDRDNKKYYKKSERRVAIVNGNYVVIIQLFNENKARFITAYVADTEYTLDKILKGPDWK